MRKYQKKVFVGMSGGVDSSVAAALLQRQGYDVTGVFIKVWQADFLACTWREERLDAMRVAAKLGIPFLTFDFEKEYKREVVDSMVAEYKAGRTPNPDVMCNRHIKFGAFWREAKKRGADFIATGHYAQLKKRKKFELLASADSEKDQTYFLWTLTQDDLSHSLFPVGHLKKPQVRALAQKFQLPTAEKKDSQGLCFIGHVDMKDFLAHYLKPKRGEVLDRTGTVIGTHDGAYFYTIGQRHGFSITKNVPTGAPLYVVSKDIRQNTLTVAERRALANSAHEVSDSDIRDNIAEISIASCVWNDLSMATRKSDTAYSARIRYRQLLQKCFFRRNGPNMRNAIVSFQQPQQAVSPGQSLVLYSTDGKKCLGGGVIVDTK